MIDCLTMENTLRQQIEELSLHNTVVHQVRTMAQVNGLDWVTTMEHMVIHLAKDNNDLNQELNAYVQRYGVLPE